MPVTFLTPEDLPQPFNPSALQAQIDALALRVTALETAQPPDPPTNRQLLGGSDFTLLGHYTIDRLAGYMFGGGGELNYGTAFTHRYVDGQLRFLTFGYWSGQRLVELPCPANYGDTVTVATNVWQDVAVTGGHCGIDWIDGKLWFAEGIDYPQSTAEEAETKSLSTRTLNANGTTTGRRGNWGLSGINGRRIYGGVCKIPQWFQVAHGVGPFAAGFGGYASRLVVGPVSLGATLYAIPDPHSYADQTEIPASAFSMLMDHSYGSNADGYTSNWPTNYDRGVRPANVTNNYDYGQWLSPAPDGKGRCVWGDTYSNTGNWIDDDAGTRGKHGFVLVPTFATGNVHYANSTLNFEGRGYEIQVFDPADFAAVKNGTKNPWNVQPVASKDITADLAALGHTDGGSGFLIPGGVCGASFDATTNLLYVYANDSSQGRHSHILVYQVG